MFEYVQWQVLSAMQLTDDGLTFREVLDAVSTDPASLIAVALVLGFFGLIVYFGAIRTADGGPAPGRDRPTGPAQTAQPEVRERARRGASRGDRHPDSLQVLLEKRVPGDQHALRPWDHGTPLRRPPRRGRGRPRGR